MNSPYSMSYPADEHYPNANSTPAFAAAFAPFSKPKSLVNLKVTVIGAGVLWVGLWDSKATAAQNPAANDANAVLIDIAPVAGPGWYQTSIHGGQDLAGGLWVGLYSTAARALAGGAPDGGANMLVKADWSAPKILPG